ncbi:MAG: hypothetical protein ACI9EF_002742 [Pseudohongiellaceae bacterium]|jgi:hypothetical protein
MLGLFIQCVSVLSLMGSAVFCAPCPPGAVVGTGNLVPVAGPSDPESDRAVEEQLDRLRRLLIELRDLEPELFEEGLLSRQRSQSGGDGSMDDLAAKLGKEVSLFERAVLSIEKAAAAPEASETGPVMTVERDLPGSPVRYSVALPEDGHVDNWSIEIANIGDVPLVAPSLLANGRRNWQDIDSVLHEAVGDSSNETEQAMSLWKFLVENRYHSDPAHDRAENHDPVRMLNIYGYGFCDDSATVYVAMAKALGLEARVWGLSGHVVPEVYFEGGWHLLDPDGEVYYRSRDGRNVASVEELADHPELLNVPVLVEGRVKPKYDFATVSPIYSSKENNRVTGRAPPTEFHSMDFTLRPGERIVRSWGNEGHRFANGYYGVPKRFGNGEWIYDLPLVSAAERPTVVEFELPYPILGGTVMIRLADDARAGQWRMEAKTAMDEWVTLPWADGDSTRPVAGLAEVLNNGFGDPDYGVTLRLTPLADEPIGRVLSIHTSLAFQLAPAALPALEPGENTLLWNCESPQGRARVTHRYRELAP